MSRHIPHLVRSTLLSLALVTLGCSDTPTATKLGTIAPGRLTLRGTRSFDANGAPAIQDKAVVPATFAVAIIDSTGGPFILAFNDHGGGVGDLFILSLKETRTGTFGPCADGPSTTYPDGSILTLAGPCQVRFLEDVRGSGNVFSSRTFLSSIGGSVNVKAVGDRLVGTVTDLRLSAMRSNGDDENVMTLASGDFDLPILRGAEAHLVSTCFFATAVGTKCGE